MLCRNFKVAPKYDKVPCTFRFMFCSICEVRERGRKGRIYFVLFYMCSIVILCSIDSKVQTHYFVQLCACSMVHGHKFAKLKPTYHQK